jgi:hypothetical protein
VQAIFNRNTFNRIPEKEILASTRPPEMEDQLEPEMGYQREPEMEV